MRSAAASAAETLGETPKPVRRGTEGNPLAAGLIAFGAGWLVASLLPGTEREREVVGQARISRANTPSQSWSRPRGR
ncbi:hypothetical protein QRX50_19710 [Amycolatopsis carbonis]|uniref:Uncharacterized protein n=1 Tax=Amycolatopsis carbonis TaxID=715471 RepID=A0A9Y2ITI4_9PSEU|nr:hypothetical protein [Amycolatopsis sp. 2-15]WIX84268.1 hypothetical protein QRX50_19710 [Amycolatopsis sp. 2-15]